MSKANLTWTNQDAITLGIVSLQLSYSTADIERSIFYGAESSPLEPSQPVEKATLLVVHGEMFVLEEEKPIPQPSVPLTEESGLFWIVGSAGTGG